MRTLRKPLVGDSAFFGVTGVGYLVWGLVAMLVQGWEQYRWMALLVGGGVSLALGILFLVTGLRATQRPAMLVELRIFVVLEVFFLLVVPVYWLMAREVTGTAALVLTFCLSTMLMLYLLIAALRHDERPEDRETADIIEGAGELGFFPPRSVWPMVCAAILGFSLLGPIFGWWMTILGVAIGLWAISMWIYEYYRGDYAH